MLKIKVFISVIILACFLFLPEVLLAQSANPVNNIDCTVDSPVCRELRSGGNPLFGADGILTTVAGIFALLVGVISVFMIIIGGLRYIMSAGDPQKTAEAKNTIMYAAIGVAVASVAGLAVQFILSQI